MKKYNFFEFSLHPIKIMIYLSVFFLVLYPYTVSLSRYVYFSTIIKYLTLIFAAASFFVAYLIVGKKKALNKNFLSLNKLELIMMIVGLYITIDNYELKHGSFYYVISYWCVWIAIIAGKYLDNWQACLYKLLQVFTMFYAVVTIVCFFSPFIYFKFVIPLFDIESQKQLIKAYQNGFMAGLTDHYSTNGMYLSVGLGIFGSVLLNDMKSIKNIIGFIVMLAALLLTGKRGPLLFSIVSLVIVYYFFKSDKPKGRLIKIFGILFLGLVALLIASIWVPQLLNVLNRFFSESNSGDVTAGRGPLYDLAFKLFKEKPIFGHGWGSYPSYYYENLGKYMSVYKYRHAHNIYLQLLCESGIVGFALNILFFLYNLFSTIMLFTQYRKSKKYLQQSAGFAMPYCLFIQVFFLLYGMTGNPLYDVAVLFPYYFSIMYVNYYKFNAIKIKNVNKLIDVLIKKGGIKIV